MRGESDPLSHLADEEWNEILKRTWEELDPLLILQTKSNYVG